jgi:hypothetical protein
MAETSQDPPRTPAESTTPRPSTATRNLATPEPPPPPPIDAGLIPPGSSASAPDSVADSIVTHTTTVGGTGQTQVNVVNREFTSRPSTSDKSPTFYPQLPAKKTQADDDEDSEMSESTADRTHISSAMGHRRPPSRSHVPAIMPSYSFYHPLRPPAVVKAEGQRQIPQPESKQETDGSSKSRPASDEVASVQGKPSTEPLLPRGIVAKGSVRPLNPVMEVASRTTSMLSTQLLAIAPAVQSSPTSSPPQNGDIPKKRTKRTRNWEHFPGKTRYHLGGRIQSSNQYLASIFIATLIIIPIALYFVFTYLFSI